MESLYGDAYVPLGSTTVAPSLREGDYLEFFNPGSMSSWSSRFLPSSDEELGLSSAQGTLLARLIYGAILSERFSYRQDLIDPLLESALGTSTPPASIEELKAIASHLDVVGTELREDIVYSASIGAEDCHLFAQEECVEPLLRDFINYVASVGSGRCGVQYLASVLLQILSIHPLADGNGRLARHLVLRTAARENLLGTAGLIIGIQWFNRKWFNELAMDSRASGLDCYLKKYKRVFRAVHLRVLGSELLMRMLGASLASSERAAREEEVVINKLIATGEIDLNQIRALLSCSSGKAKDTAARVAARIGLGSNQESTLSIEKMFAEVKGLLFI
jgi:hypothetical protein